MACQCEACALEREARQIGEDIDSMMPALAQAMERHGEDADIVRRGFALIDRMDAQMQAAAAKARTLRREQMKEQQKEHARHGQDWLRGA